MNPEKSEMKLIVLQTHGEKVEQKMEQHRLEIMATEAALKVLMMTREEHQKALINIEAETRTGQLTPAQATIARKYTKKCCDFVDNFVKGTEIKLFMAKGKLEALQDVVGNLRSDRDEERKKLDGFRQAQERALEELKTGTEKAEPEAPVTPRKSRKIREDVARSLGISNKK
jgi:hypothetical protein